MLQHDLVEISLRLLVAAFLGGLIGFERELSQKPAGMRTHILIAIGATVYAMLSVILREMFPGTFDISRMASQIVVGVGFLGAGTIMRSEGSVGGLTTAAGVWVVAAIGTLVGFGLYKVAAIATLLVFCVLMVFAPYEKKMISRVRGFRLRK